MFEHLGISHVTENKFKYSENTATSIRKHIHHSAHNADAGDFKIIGNAANDYHLKLKESLMIAKLKPSLNIASESMPLYLFDN